MVKSAKSVGNSGRTVGVENVVDVVTGSKDWICWKLQLTRDTHRLKQPLGDRRLDVTIQEQTPFIYTDSKIMIRYNTLA